MKRRYPGPMTWLSLVLCIASAALWLRSRGNIDNAIVFIHGGAMQSFASLPGRTEIILSDVPAGPRRAWSMQLVGAPFVGPDDDPLRSPGSGVPYLTRDQSFLATALGNRAIEPRQFGFGFVNLTNPPDINYPNGSAIALMLPHWFWLTLFAILPARHAFRWCRARRWGHAGRCPTCGYDLRASPEQCPECGLVPSSGGRGRRGGTRDWCL